MMTPSELYSYVQQTIIRIAETDSSSGDKIGDVYRLLTHFLISVGERDQLHFSTLFARISYLTTKHALHAGLGRLLHHFRIASEEFLRKGKVDGELTEEQIWQNGAYGLLRVASQVLHVPLSTQAAELFHEDIPILPEANGADGFVREVFVVVTDIDEEAAILSGNMAPGGEQIQIAYKEPGRSELFARNVIDAIDLLGLPINISIVDSEVDRQGVYTPRMIVIEPDYLVDVTAVAECFRETGSDSRMYLLSKYLPREVTVPILIGNMVNFFLDELIHDSQTSFRQLIPKTFQLNPIAFCTLSDRDVYMMSKKAEMHFDNLRRAVIRDFKQLGIAPENTYIEPSFYAPAFGIQGRLDLYHTTHQGKADIIELKSAQPFKPNTYGLSSTHYTQTLLYDLMVRAVHSFKITPASYILYSSQISNPMRYAPPVQSIQREAIKLRNEIFLKERQISRDPELKSLRKLLPRNFPEARGFIEKNVQRFARVMQQLSNIEFKYFRAFTSFVAEEHFLAKVGTQGADRINGVASLWLDPISVKEERFCVFKDLCITSIDANANDAMVELNKGKNTNVLANFRIGDIAVLYPDEGVAKSVLRNQIYKCTIISLTQDSITIRLRNKQVNYQHMRSHEYWVLEHDLLDSSFISMQRSLFAFAEASPPKRMLFLGNAAPRQPIEAPMLFDGRVDPAILEILKRIIGAQDYFLLWGPPGTGKTSVVLHHLVKYYRDQTDQRILLMAYTNRAVDEICKALDAIGGNIRDEYIRIGSRYAANPEYQGQLLSSKISGMTSRKALQQMLERQRIIVSTISSMAGKQELFDLIAIDTVIVDEASQILEPMLSGMLPRFNKWILIGDHRQLPAVVFQSPQQTVIDDPDCATIHLTNTRMSYFERMYLLCSARGWDWAIGALYAQGRMHEDIMKFPSEVFYDGRLRGLKPGPAFHRDLTAPMEYRPTDTTDPVMRNMMRYRMLFVPSKTQSVPGWTKTHDHEAQLVVQIFKLICSLYNGHKKLPSIGIITPFRAQIANIRDHMSQAGLDTGNITIDTVERYQGSARDIIILSLCINHPVQLDQIMSLSTDGVDRKLNVALTRAREQFILIANPEVLAANALYTELLKACHRMELNS